MKVLEHRLDRQWVSAVILAIYSLATILVEMGSLGIDAAVELIVAKAICLVFCIYAMFVHMKPLTCGAMFTIVIGIGTIVTFFPEVFSENILTFTYGILMCVCGIICTIFGISMYVGCKYNSMRISILQYCVLLFIIIRFMIKFYTVGNFETAFHDELYYLLACIQCFVLIYLMNDPRIKYVSCNQRVIRSTAVLNSVMCNDPLATILRTDLKKILDMDNWDVVYGNGLYSRELAIPIISSESKMYLMLRKMIDGTITGEVTYTKDSNSIQNPKFILSYVDVYGDIDTTIKATLYGKKGFFITILISDKKKNVEYTKGEKIKRMIFGLNQKELDSIYKKIKSSK